MSSEEEKDVSCFSVDGVVAEMVIDIDDGDKTGQEDIGDNELSLEKNSKNTKKTAEEEKDTADESIEEHLKMLEKDNGPSSVKSDDVDSNQSLKETKKRKHESHSDDGGEADNLDQPRYPGRKRQMNKKFFSEELVSGEKKKSDSVHSNESSNGKSSTTKETIPDTNIASAIQLKQGSLSKSSTTKDIKETTVTDDVRSKQDTLRKLPFRKNKDAPDVDDLKPKVVWWNGVGEGPGKRLGDIFAIRERIKSSKSMRPLFRVLYFQWPTNGTDLIEQILKFNGFPFEKTSYEFSKRQTMMRIMLDRTISHIGEILGLKIKPKNEMIDDILHFLLSPYGESDPSKDESMQPVVLLERIFLEKKFFEDALKYNKQTSSEPVSSKEASSKATSARTTRRAKFEPITYKPGRKKTKASPNTSAEKEKSMSKRTSVANKSLPKAKLDKSKVTAEKIKADIKPKSEEKTKPLEKGTPKKKDDEKPILTKEKAKEEKPKMKKISKVQVKTKQREVKVKDTAGLDEDLSSDYTSPSSTDTEIEISKMKKKIKQLKKEIKKKKTLQEMKSMKRVTKKSVSAFKSTKVPSDDNSMDVDDAPEVPSGSQSKDNEKKKEVEKRPADKAPSDSSETESSDETKLASTETSPRKNVRVRVGRPLKSFPGIRSSIQDASFSALQRLHILLFGSSDKAENLKSNILAFGGFPFLEGSEDWKQKHFLLSLLAQNNLREYLTLLCIESREDEDQSSMIAKLMKFLAAPMDPSEPSKSSVIETEVVSSELVPKPSTSNPKSKKQEKAKPVSKKKKKEEKKTGPRHRKILMSEEEARRLEAKFAREQRALARERELYKAKFQQEAKKVAPAPPSVLPVKRPVKEVEFTPKVLSTVVPVNSTQLNALLQTVYKRRALKAAGAVISTPNKGEKVKLGDIENVKFLVVTSNLRDLELLHRLIFLCDATKSKVRKNILDFCGFSFNEDSHQYTERMDFLKELGYDVSKRLSFLLGLCGLHTTIVQQDLNELIMYFLMAPCKSKQAVPITQMPSDKGFIVHVDKNPILIKPANETPKTSVFQAALRTAPGVPPNPNTNASNTSFVNLPSPNHEMNIQTSTPLPVAGKPKAKKSISGASLQVSPVKKVLLPPSALSNLPPGLHFPAGITGKKLILGNKPVTGTVQGTNTVLQGLNAKLVNNVMQSMDNKASNILSQCMPNSAHSITPIPKLPLNPGANLQLINPGSNVAVLDPAGKSQSVNMTPVVPSQLSKVVLPLQNVLTPKKSEAFTAPVTSPQEYLVQQQTPDGKMKTFKLIRVPANHPLATAVKPAISTTAVTASTTTQPPLTFSSPSVAAANLPPGIIIMKNTATQEKVITIPQSTAMSLNMPGHTLAVLAKPGSPAKQVFPPSGHLLANSSMDEDLLETSDSDPSDKELYSVIQDIILSANFEDITLRNVIERVAAHFPNCDLRHRHGFMKESIKKIIIGTE